jgi:hypothetical protein
MSEEKGPYVREIVFPPATLKHLEDDAKKNGRSFNDQVIYVLTVGHRELDHRPPLPKARHKRQEGSTDVARDGSGT